MPKGRYHAAFNPPNGAGDARPTALQIVRDEDMLDALPHATILITGCSSGIGVETARALHTTGATIYVTARDVPRTEVVLTDLISQGRTHVLHMDLASLTSVRAGAAHFLKQSQGRLNVLVANAAVMALPTRTLSADGFEMQLATNHLGHFLLFNLLKEALQRSSTSDFNSRVVMVASSGHLGSGIVFEDMNLEKEGAYSPWKAYGQAKTANIYMANYIDRHFGDGSGSASASGGGGGGGGAGVIHANALMPGGIVTPLQKHVSVEQRAKWAAIPNLDKLMCDEKQGAATTTWAAIGREWEGKGGKYLEEVQVAGPSPDADLGQKGGHAKWAFDEAKEDRCWKESLRLVGLEASE